MCPMYYILSPLKYFKHKKLIKTQWKCDLGIEDAEYYELDFISASLVEGYTKLASEAEPKLMFTASYAFKDKTTIAFSNKNEHFTALLSSNVLMATIDKEVLLFKKK